MKLPNREIITDKLKRGILYRPELFLQAYAEGKLIEYKKLKKLNIEKIVKKFLKDLQWDLRWSYNSSSCLNSKQKEFLEDKLYDLLITIRDCE